MLAAILPGLIVLLSVFAIGSAIVLVRAAIRRPRIGALVERAAIAVLLAYFGVVCSIVVFNTEVSQALFSTEISRLLFRISVVILLGIPTYWTFLYLTGRLGGLGLTCAVVIDGIKCNQPAVVLVEIRDGAWPGLSLWTAICAEHRLELASRIVTEDSHAGRR